MLHSSVFSFTKGQNKGKSIDIYSQKNILKNGKKVLDKLSQM